MFRRTRNTRWKKIAEVEGNQCVDREAVAGTEYIYTVRGVSASGSALNTYYDIMGVRAVSQCDWYAPPNLLGAEAAPSGIVIRWERVPGVERYRVYRRAPGEKWKKLSEINADRCVDRTAAPGVEYTYTVRCLSGRDLVSGYDQKGVSAKR